MNNEIKNEILEVIAKRYSSRSYKTNPIEDEKVKAIIKAGLESPTANNKQAFQLVAVSDPEFLNQLDQNGIQNIPGGAPDWIKKRGNHLFYNAPLIIFVFINETDNPYAKLDGGIVSENIVLAAESLGLATCHCGMAKLSFQGELGPELLKKFNLPEGFEFANSVLIGYDNTPEDKRVPHKINLNKASYI